MTDNEGNDFDRRCGHCGSTQVTSNGGDLYECLTCRWSYPMEDLR